MVGKVQEWLCVWNWIHRRNWRCSQQRFMHDGPDTVEELLDRHLVKNKNDNDEFENRRQLTSTRCEALSLYRDILCNATSLQCLERLNTTACNRMEVMCHGFKLLQPNTRGMEPDRPCLRSFQPVHLRLCLQRFRPVTTHHPSSAPLSSTPKAACLPWTKVHMVDLSMDGRTKVHSQPETTPTAPEKVAQSLPRSGYICHGKC
ncbi:uncharacterized protein LOC111242670 [Vigna radiata var. radiata]|uniref:Uncharacterized protein LOC111242670 n=1 Tax=Vigna radiata var. radiata TaxID=3916 RepID=A0A3Q0FFF4_VIGRR|nr:uncharacterized protein LOC111242670 [Vigna radiata var. radiata]